VAVFDPVAAGYNGGDDHLITYNYTNEFDVPNEYTFTIAVDSIYPIYIAGLDPEYCVNEPILTPDPSYNLSAENLPQGGTHLWSGLATGLTQSADKATIRTALIGTGDHEIFYQYTSIYNCVRETSETFTIHPLPVVTIVDTLRTKYDKAETSTPLLGYPLGGNWDEIGTRNAVNDADGTFNPSLVGINPEYRIVYRSFEDHTTKTCYNYDTVTVEVFDFTVGIENLRTAGNLNVFCYDSGQVTIWATTTDVQGAIDSGYFQGPGIIQNMNDSMAVFDPVQAGSGVATLGLPDSPGVPPATVQDTLVARYNDLASVKGLFERYPEEIAAVIVEPVQGEGGVHLATADFLERVRARIEDEHFENEEKLPGGKLTISGGVASYPTDAETVEDLLEAADRSLYLAKAEGKNRVYLA